MNQNDWNKLITGLGDSIEYLKAEKIKRTNRMFASLDAQVDLYTSLATFTKYDLDEVRKNLNITGISSLNKQQLSETLSVKIKSLLPEIMKQLSYSDYTLIKKIIKHEGILTYTGELSLDFFRLRELGVIGCFRNASGNNYIFVPKDLLEDMDLLINNLNIVSEIKQNDKINKLLKGLLFYYGALPINIAADMINSYFKYPLAEATILNTINFGSVKSNHIYIKENYFCSEELVDLDELISEQKLKTRLNYFPLSENQVLAASADDFFDFNKFDSNLMNFLLDNFDISKAEATECLEAIKIEFAGGCDYDEALQEFLSSFELEDIEAINEAVELISLVYNNTPQWILKGNTPSQAFVTTQSTLLTTNNSHEQTPSSTVGLNSPCPCGSGKKYKNCCMK